MAFNANVSLIDNSQTMVRSNISVPNGHILCHQKWQNSELVKLLKPKVGVVFDERLGVVDFHVADKVTVVYLLEAEMLQTGVMKRRIVKFRKGLQDCGDVFGLVVAEKTRLTNDAFKIAQNLAVLELGLTMHPVPDSAGAASLLSSFIQGLSSKTVNPLTLLMSPPLSADQSILKALTTIPGLGTKSAKLLLTKFGSLQKVALASRAELAQAVGDNLANKIAHFLDA